MNSTWEMVQGTMAQRKSISDRMKTRDYRHNRVAVEYLVLGAVNDFQIKVDRLLGL